MMMKRLLILSLGLYFIITNVVLSQTQQVNYDVPFETEHQNMWGPSFDPITINQDIDIFNVPWNQSFSNKGAFFSLGGYDFGAGFSGGFSGVIGSRFSLNGFTTGEVDVSYPIDVKIKMTDDLTYDQGDEVEFETDYTVKNGWELTTRYPEMGELKLDLYFRFAASLSAKICMFSCTTFPIIPSFDTGILNINIFTLNSSGVEVLSVPSVGIPPMFSHSLLPLQTSDIPNDPLGDYGLSGWLDLPYVETSDAINGNNLSACGDSIYVNFNVDVFGLIAGLKIPYVSAVAEVMSGNETLTIGSFSANVFWTLFGADFDMNIHNSQCFDFKPKVYGRFEFPLPVSYKIFSPTNVLLESGESSIINIQMGNKIRYKFPCYFEDINITPTFSIDGQFTNHTYDEITFDFNMEVFKFGINIPKIVIIPAVHIPSWCFKVGYPCGFVSWCTKRVCTPEINTPELAFPGFNWQIGPLWTASIPLGSISYDWFKRTWALEGFDTYKMNPFKMKANPLSITHSQTNILCYGASTGSAELYPHAVSHALPYTYLWTNGATTQNLAGVPAGSYQVQVEDANGCKQFTGVILDQPIMPIQIESSVVDKKCNGGINDGEINLNVLGGTSPYQYSWSNGAPNAPSINGLDAGNYQILVTDNNGCVEMKDFEIGMPLQLQQTTLITDVLCYGNSTGKLQGIASGGTLPYSYNWSNGQTTKDINNLAAGTYTLTLSDGNNCQSVANYVINEPAQPLNLVATVTDVLCKNDNSGSIHILASGGTPNYTYEWYDESAMLPTYTGDLINQSAGTYTLKVTDDHGCTEQVTSTITEPLHELSDNPLIQNINCYGDATGSIDPNISGGTANYTYNWSDGSHNATLNNAASGIYTLQLIDANNCVKSFDYELSQPLAPLSLSLSKVDVSCHGGSDGIITPSVSGGTAPYTYLWSNSSSDEALSDLAKGYYSLTVTDAKNCTISLGINIDEPIAPLFVTSIITNVNCFADSTGEILLSTLGGTAPYSYKWTDDNSYILVEQGDLLTNKPSGSYTVFVKDAQNCEFELTSVISQPTSPLQLQSDVFPVKCYGDNSGAIDVVITGGTSPYNPQWSNGATTQNLNGILSGVYSVEIIDAKGCQIVDSMTVDQPAQPLVSSLFAKDNLCFNDSNGSASSAVTGGTKPYTYLWSNGSTTKDLIKMPAGTYSLTVTDANGCVSFSGTQINEPNAIVVDVTPNDVTCYDYKNGSIDISISGGYAPYTYNWGDTSQVLLNHFSETIDHLSEGRYFLRITDYNGCKNEQFIQINQPDSLSITSIVSDVLCYGDSTGAIEVTPIGGTAPYSYQWDDGQSTNIATELPHGNKHLVVFDANNCQYNFNFFVPQPDSLKVAYTINPLSCKDQTDAEIQVQAYGGIYPYDYLWSNGETDNNISNLSQGAYQLIIHDANSCEKQYSFMIEASSTSCINVPNTITPNGDNYNDTWIIDDIDLYPNASIKIFNKWGNLVYESNGEYIPWDGTFKGKPLPSEVYYYIIDLGTDDGESYAGTITIIR